jgi:cysteine-rich repeat protein
MTRFRRLSTLAAALVLTASSAHATFHIMSISEIMVGMGGDPDAQYVELRLELATQNLVTNTRLTAFNADGTVATVLVLSNHGVASGQTNRRILYATSEFTTLTGLTPDFTFPSGIISPTSGMICWGAPSQISVPPPTWDASDPNNYIDCVAYGGYTGPTRNAAPTLGSSGAPSALPPGDGTFSLTRIARTAQMAGSNATDFALRPPGPCVNAATSCNVRGCPSASGQCALVGCSNGNVDAGEACDDNNLSGGDGCENDCTLTPTPQQLGCRRGLVKATSKFGQAYAKTVAACEAALLAGKIMGPCPDDKTNGKLAKAETKKIAAIDKACAGVTVAGAGFATSCPGIDATCGAPIAGIADVTTCVDCVEETAGDSLVADLYPAFTGGPASARKCQQKIGSAVVKLYQAERKILAKCEDAVLLNKAAGPCPDVTAADKILQVAGKFGNALCKACYGADKICNNGDDTPLADIGITNCPAVSNPAYGDCAAANPLDGIVELSGCLNCLADRLARCTNGVDAHSKTVPAACNPVATPTATPTPTVTPTP